jgi:hypothetical protein
VDAVAAQFLSLKDNPNQLREIVRYVALRPEFAATWGAKIKRPIEFAAGVLRAVNANFSPTDSWFSNYDRMGQPMFARRPPDGYPDQRAEWSSTTSLLYRWRLCNNLMDNSITGNTVDVVSQNVANTPETIADFWISRLLGRPMDYAENRTEVIKLMTPSGKTATSVLTSTEISDRLRRTVALILNSPEFQWR